MPPKKIATIPENITTITVSFVVSFLVGQVIFLSSTFDSLRYWATLLKMFFDSTNVFKVYETPESQIYRNIPIQGVPQQEIPPQNINQAEVGIQCPQCKNEIKLQANFKENIPVKAGMIKMPKEDKIQCPNCKKEIDLVDLKKTIEGQVRRRIVYGQG